MLDSKRRAILFLGLSFLVAIIAGFFFLQQYQQINAELGGMTEVYVANDDISSREVFDPEHITTMEIPNRYVTSSHIVDLSELEGMISIVPLAEDEIITQNILRPYANVTDEDNRLVSLFNSDGVSFDQELEAMDRVDIIASHDFEGEQETELFMADVPVAMVSEGNENDEESSYGIAVEVPQETAPELIHMQNYADSVRILQSSAGLSEEDLEEMTEEELHEYMFGEQNDD